MSLYIQKLENHTKKIRLISKLKLILLKISSMDIFEIFEGPDVKTKEVQLMIEAKSRTACLKF